MEYVTIIVNDLTQNVTVQIVEEVTEISISVLSGGIKGDTGLQGIQGVKGDTGLQGIQGIQGIQGVAGTNGVNGESAYEIAVNNGFIGTEAEWIASLEVPTNLSSFVNDGEEINGGDRFLLESEIAGYIPLATVDKETVLFMGDAIWQSGLTFYVYATKYKINGVLREGLISATVTGTSDVTFGRILSFIIRNDGLGDTIANDTIILLNGTPSEVPVKDVLNNELELEISFAILGVNATEPTPTNDSGLLVETVYAENIEWAITGATGTVNAASTSLPITGAVSILHTYPEHQKSIYFTTLTPLFTSSQAVLQFDIKLDTTWQIVSKNGTTIDVYLWKGNNRFTGRIRVGSDLGLNFDNYNITTKQTVYIRLERFAGIFASNTYDKIQFQYQRTTNEIFRIDNIKIVEGYGGVLQEQITHTHTNLSVLETITSTLISNWNTAYNWVLTNGANVLNHLANIANPHGVTKSQVGLGNVDNTSDANKPVSTAQQTALNLKLDDTDALTAVTPTNKIVTQADITSFGGGDMLKATYDPTTVNGDAFATDLMKNATVAKTTPIDADNLTLWDSVSSSFKKVTWANVKATLKDYFDTIYGTVAMAKFETIAYACSDETTDLTLGNKISIRMPFAMTLSEIRIDVVTAPTGSAIVCDVKESGVSIFSTLPSIDATEFSSVTAAVPAVISDVNLADNALLVVSVTQVGSIVVGAGLKITLKGNRI